MSNYNIREAVKKINKNSRIETLESLKSSLVAIHCFSITLDLSNIIFSSGYTPTRFDIINKGFLLLYYTNPYTATMAAWFFEIKGIPTATMSRWSLLRVCGPNKIEEITEIIPYKPFAISFFKHKGKYSWIAVHGIHAKELVIRYIRSQKWSIIETLHDRNFLDVIEIMEMCSKEEIPHCDKKLECLFIKFLQQRSINSMNSFRDSDQLKLQQNLILLSRCSRLPHEIELDGIVIKNASKRRAYQFNIYSLLAIRNQLYNIPMFLEACLPNKSLNTLKIEECSISSSRYTKLNSRGENKRSRKESNQNKDVLASNTFINEVENQSDILICILRVILIEILSQLRSEDAENKYPNIFEIRQLWMRRFGVEVDIIHLFRFAGLSNEINNILASSYEEDILDVLNDNFYSNQYTENTQFSVENTS